MSEWVRAGISNPPESHSVVLYVVQFHDDGETLWSADMYVGFYGDTDWEKTGFYYDVPGGDPVYIEESKTFKVVAWTLLPRKPYKDILTGDWSG